MIPQFEDQTSTIKARPPIESSSLTRRFPARPDRFTFEPSERWVRGIAGDTAVVDSKAQFLIWEPLAKVPEYLFPRAHVRTDLMTRSATPPAPGSFYRPTTDQVEWFDLVIGSRRINHAAWTWLVPGLEDYLTVNWFAGVLDGWFEEDEPVHTHPRDPYNRVDAIPSSRHIIVRSQDGITLAETHAPVLVYETELPIRYYIPPQDVDFDKLEPLAERSSCPYKGFADNYWQLPGTGKPVAWSYPDPVPNLAVVTDYVAFYQERTTIVVDGIRA